MREVVADALHAQELKAASVEARAKTLESFRIKASQPSENDPNRPKYLDPFSEITDLAGVRVIVFFPKDLEVVGGVLAEQFDILEKSDKRESLIEDERFGYQSIHFLVRMKPNRTVLPEYSRFSDRVAEIQVRTVLQHAWAEIEHDIQYKSVENMPKSIRRRFMALAGVLEIADREFQAIQDEDTAQREAARQAVETGELTDVEITPDALKAYLDRRLGPDGRMSTFSYEYSARLLRRLGFEDFHQVDEAIAPYDHDAVSRVVWGSRQGQLSRFDDLVFAALGEQYIERHHWSSEPWFEPALLSRLKKLQSAGVATGTYSLAAKGAG